MLGGRGYFRFALGLAVVSAIMALTAGFMLVTGWEPGQGGRMDAAPPGQFVRTAAAQPVPALSFADASGRKVQLADFAGRVVLLNLWATWCPPCVREMPALEHLQQSLGSADFQVVVLSQDRGGAAAVVPFFDKLGLKALTPYLDPAGAAAKAFAVPGLPSTILIGRDGREVGRLLGGYAWDGPAARRLIDEALAGART